MARIKTDSIWKNKAHRLNFYRNDLTFCSFTALWPGSLLHEFFHGAEQGFVAGMILEHRLPDLFCLFLCPLYPEDLAQMGGYFRIWVHSECLPQEAEPLIEVTHAVMHPAQAVHDVG